MNFSQARHTNAGFVRAINGYPPAIETPLSPRLRIMPPTTGNDNLPDLVIGRGVDPFEFDINEVSTMSVNSKGILYVYAWSGKDQAITFHIRDMLSFTGWKESKYGKATTKRDGGVQAAMVANDSDTCQQVKGVEDILRMIAIINARTGVDTLVGTVPIKSMTTESKKKNADGVNYKSVWLSVTAGYIPKDDEVYGNKYAGELLTKGLTVYSENPHTGEELVRYSLDGSTGLRGPVDDPITVEQLSDLTKSIAEGDDLRRFDLEITLRYMVWSSKSQSLVPIWRVTGLMVPNTRFENRDGKVTPLKDIQSTQVVEEDDEETDVSGEEEEEEEEDEEDEEDDSKQVSKKKKAPRKRQAKKKGKIFSALTRLRKNVNRRKILQCESPPSSWERDYSSIEESEDEDEGEVVDLVKKHGLIEASSESEYNSELDGEGDAVEQDFLASDGSVTSHYTTSESEAESDFESESEFELELESESDEYDSDGEFFCSVLSSFRLA